MDHQAAQDWLDRYVEAGEDESGDASSRDLPGTHEATYCFVMRFDGDGCCREFTEYYLKRP